VAGEQIIDLDRGRDLLESPDPSRPRRGPWRLIGFVTMLALCLASLGAARRPPAPPFTHLGFIVRPVGSSPMQGPEEIALVGEILLARKGSQLIAFDPDGRQRWEVPMEGEEPANLTYRMWRGNLLVRRDLMIRYSDEYPGRSAGGTVALDPATGAERWRVDGGVMEAADVVVVDDGGHERIYRSLPSDLLWTMPPALASTVDAKGGAIFAVTEEGVLTEYDLRTGAVRGTGNVEVPHTTSTYEPARGPRREAISIEVSGDRILLRAQPYGIYFGDGSPLVRVYDRATLLPASTPLALFDFTVNCGPVICAYAGEQVSILDAEELTELWQVPRGDYPQWNGSMMVVPGVSGDAPARVVDPRTGRTLMTLDRWRFLVQRDIPPDLTWFIQALPNGRTSVAVLEPSGLRVLGSLPEPVVDCQANERLIACVAPDGRIDVWRASLG
jgi:PQQ-like domain